MSSIARGESIAGCTGQQGKVRSSIREPSLEAEQKQYTFTSLTKAYCLAYMSMCKVENYFYPYLSLPLSLSPSLSLSLSSLLLLAIERAMAYLDTGALPWNMDLFDTKMDVSLVCTAL